MEVGESGEHTCWLPEFYVSENSPGIIFSLKTFFCFTPPKFAVREVYCPRTVDTLCKISSICAVQAGREMSVTASLLRFVMGS